MYNCVPNNKSFQSELHERAWYLQQKQPVESNNEIDRTIKKKKFSVKYDCPLEGLMKSFEDIADMMSFGLYMIRFTLFVICGLVALANFVIICIYPTIQEHEIYLERARVVSGILWVGIVFIVFIAYSSQWFYFFLVFCQ